MHLGEDGSLDKAQRGPLPHSGGGTHLGVCSAFPGRNPCRSQGPAPGTFCCPKREWGRGPVGCVTTGQDTGYRGWVSGHKEGGTLKAAWSVFTQHSVLLQTCSDSCQELPHLDEP